MTDKQLLEQALEKAYLAGFNASGEGYNGEYPFGDKTQDPEHDPMWCKDRENELTAIRARLDHMEDNLAMVAAPVQEPVALTDATVALKDLKAVLTDPDGNVCWQGSYADRDIIGDALEKFEKFLTTPAAQPAAAPVQEPAKAPGMAVQALAGEIIEALLADEEDGGYDLTAGLFGPAFSKLVRRWANAEWATPPAAQPAPVQEPVAWFWFDERNGGEWIHIADNQTNADKFGNAKVIPLYTIPFAAPDLSKLKPENQQKMREWIADGSFAQRAIDTMFEMSEEITALKKAQPAPVQEPVAWKPSKEQFTAWCRRHGMQLSDRDAFYDAATLYLLSFASLIKPASKQQWVGLEPEEIAEILSVHYMYMSDLVQAIEAKLKEKNT